MNADKPNEKVPHEQRIANIEQDTESYCLHVERFDVNDIKIDDEFVLLIVDQDEEDAFVSSTLALSI